MGEDDSPCWHVQGSAWLSTVVGRCIRIQLSDGRVVAGELACLDRDLNLVLFSAELLRDSPTAPADPILLGTVTVPGRHITRLLVPPELRPPLAHQ